MEETSLRSVIAGFIASFLYWFYAISYKPDGLLGINKIGNIKTYVVFVIIFTCVYLLGLLVQKKHQFLSGRVNIAFSCAVYVIFALASFSIIKENVILTNRVGLILEVIAVILCFALFFALYRKNLLCLESNRFLSILFVGFVALIWYQNVTANNIFVYSCPEAGYDIYFNVHHSSAYLDEIYAVWHKQPFVGGITEQYGHYAFLFIIPMKIFGATVNTIGKTCGVISGLSGGLITYCVFKVVKNDVSKIIFGIIMIGAGMFPSYIQIYWQTYPQRFLIPAITVAYILYICDKELKVWHYILGFIITCLGFLFSTDSGLVCLLCYAAFMALRVLRDKGFNVKAFLKALALALLHVIAAPICALGLTNLYNAFCGGKLLSFIAYLTMDNEGYIQSLQYDIEFWSNSYSYKLIALFLVLAMTAYYLLGKSQEEFYKCNVVFMSNAIIGVGMITYFINRPIAGSAMVNPYVYVCYIAIIELFNKDIVCDGYSWLKDKVLKNLKLGVVFVTFIFLFIECQGYINNFHYANAKNEAGAYDYGSIVNSANEIKEYLDKDVTAVGIGTSALFFELGIDKNSYRFDTADMSDAWNGNQVFMWRGYEEEYLPSNYGLVREFFINGMEYGIYEQI